jgi:ubiquinone/menaquinone biosynthesis C-methylase UbiE
MPPDTTLAVETSATAASTDRAQPAFAAYQDAHQAHWDQVAERLAAWRGWGTHYHRRLARVFQFLVPRGLRVLEVGCGNGDLLAALYPAVGIGLDFSRRMLEHARTRHPELRFVQADAHQLSLHGSFDVVILSDLLNDVWDVETVLVQVRRICHPRTRILINSYSRVWEPVLSLADRLGLAKPTLHQNWLSSEDLRNLLYLSGFDVIRGWEEILWPLATPLLEPLLNRVMVRLWPANLLALTFCLVARPAPCPHPAGATPKVSVVIPCRNEAGNIEGIFLRVPRMGRETELIFVEGHSSDQTFEAIQTAAAAHPDRPSSLQRQAGVGKGDAVRAGFDHATGDMLMILDADLTVRPEDLRRFYEALVSGRAEFANGVRLIYPMQDEAMRFANLIANRMFSQLFRWLLGQPVKDTLCGTKVLWRADYARIAQARADFGEFDPFGDFDLLFGAARQSLKIVDVPVRYQARTYGKTNIQRWRHGWLLLRMVAFAARRLKFI